MDMHVTRSGRGDLKEFQRGEPVTNQCLAEIICPTRLTMKYGVIRTDLIIRSPRVLHSLKWKEGNPTMTIVMCACFAAHLSIGDILY